MKRTTIGRRCFTFAACILSFSSLAIGADRTGANWPSFRGPGAGGVAEGHTLPVEWDVESGENIKWKTPIPGLAHSSPVIWGDRIFITTAVSADPDPFLRVGLYGESPDHPENFEHDFRVYCLDKQTGKIIWEKSAHKGIPKAKRHIKATQANCTPTTDGKHVLAFFASEGLYCYDMNGTLLWRRDLGYMDSGPPNKGAEELDWGYSSSPIIHDGKAIVLCANRRNSFLGALDIETGKDIWRTERPAYPGWCTPTVHVGKDRSQIITNGYLRIGGYDLNTGKEIWWMKGGGDIPVPTPVVAHDLIYIASGHGRQAPVYAVRTSATGDITLTGRRVRGVKPIAWHNLKVGNYMQTPLIYGDLLYCCRDSGVLSVFDAKNGNRKYRERLSGKVGFTASPVAGDGKIYFTSEEGDVFVIKTGRQYELLAKNQMNEICMATPAISEGSLFFRTKGHVVAIGK